MTTTKLHEAAEANDATRIVGLIAGGADLHARDEHGNTPLHLAAVHSAEEASRTLIELGADRQARNNAGQTALELTERPGPAGEAQEGPDMPGRYELPAPARQILDRAAPALLAALTREEILIGGGTALAARWGHRTSTDIDITVPPAAFSRSAGQLIERLGQTGLMQIESGQGWMKGVYEEGEFSIATTAPLLPAPAGPVQRESSWNIALESIEEILARKLLLRMYRNGEFVVRDFYDVVTAADQAPPALEAALVVLKDDQRREIADEITRLGARLGRGIINLGRPLLDVCRPDWLPTLANRAAVLIAEGPPAEAAAEPDSSPGP